MDERADINNLDPSIIKQIIDKKIGIFFGACSIAYRNIENDYFLDLVYTLISLKPDVAAQYTVPKRETLSKTIIPAVQKDLDEAKKKLLNNTNSILLLDAWLNTSINRKFLVFSLRNANISQVYLDFYDFSAEAEDGPMLGRQIVEAIKLAETKYNTKVCGVINDNASNIKLGASIASDMVIEDNINLNGLFQSTCYSHSGNLLIKDIVDQSFLEQLSKVVKAFSSVKLEDKIYRKGGCPLKNYPDTRFAYVIYTCESIYKNLDVLKEITQEEPVAEEVCTLVNDFEFERRLWGTMKLLTPILKLINHCQDPKVNVAEGTELWLSLQLRTNEHDQKIQDRIVKAISDVGFAANLMHHVYKGERLDEDQVACAKRFLRRNLDNAGEAELDHFLETRNNPFNNQLAENCKDPIAYWAIKNLEYPLPGELCQKVMLMPASTAVLEGLFSQWTYVHNKYRNKLSNKSTGLLIDIYHLTKHLDRGIWREVKEKRKRKRIDLDED